MTSTPITVHVNVEYLLTTLPLLFAQPCCYLCRLYRYVNVVMTRVDYYQNIYILYYKHLTYESFENSKSILQICYLQTI